MYKIESLIVDVKIEICKITCWNFEVTNWNLEVTSQNLKIISWNFEAEG
jgi:hypothetical protein